jgi:hypothetical protein
VFIRPSRQLLEHRSCKNGRAGWEGSFFVERRNLRNFLYQSNHSNLFRFVDKDVLGFKNTHKKHDAMMVNLLPLEVMA